MNQHEWAVMREFVDSWLHIKRVHPQDKWGRENSTTMLKKEFADYLKKCGIFCTLTVRDMGKILTSLGYQVKQARAGTKRMEVAMMNKVIVPKRQMAKFLEARKRKCDQPQVCSSSSDTTKMTQDPNTEPTDS